MACFYMLDFRVYVGFHALGHSGMGSYRAESWNSLCRPLNSQIICFCLLGAGIKGHIPACLPHALCYIISLTYKSEKLHFSLVWHMPVVSVIRRLRQQDCFEVEASQSHRVGETQ